MDFNGNSNCDKIKTIHTQSDSDICINKTLSIEIKVSDEIIILPNVEECKYDYVQYVKLIETPKDILFFYNDVEKGKMYHHRLQTIIFHKFSSNEKITWIL